jgi:hypothetical protein
VDPTRNPFSPGAGTQPPELAGRDALIEGARVALTRIRDGRSARSQLFLGLRGVGKTVLLNRVHQIAAELGYVTVMLEAPEDRRLADLLVPPLRSALYKLSNMAAAANAAKQALGALRAFASAFKVRVGDVEFGVEAAVGTADSGALDYDLSQVFEEAGNAARAARTPIVLLIDEVQYLHGEDLSALIVALHRSAQSGLPLMLFGAGLPQLTGLAGNAKSYAERLFDYPEVGSLTDAAAREAIKAPVAREHVGIGAEALTRIVEQTQGYPYFLQEWGAAAWDVARASPISVRDIDTASIAALKRLDEGFFRVRLDRVSPRERDYLRAMAELGPGPHRSGEIAKLLGVGVTSVGPLRSGLIAKGMIYSRQYGETAFTVPMFDRFMKRTMPRWAPRSLSKQKRKRTKRPMQRQ